MKAIISLIFILLISSASHAQFINESAMLGPEIIFTSPTEMIGISFYDFDKDGWDDISLTTGSGQPVFLKNESGSFTLANLNINNNNEQTIVMLLWADYDNDGDSDLLITKYNGAIELWQNQGDMNFVEVSTAAGFLSGNYLHAGAAFCDYDHDGFLDVYIAKNYDPFLYTTAEFSGNLYHNNGDGTFTDITLSSGTYLSPRPTFQPVFFDYDNDGWEDLFLVVDKLFTPNELFRNNGDGTFTNVSIETGMQLYLDAMSGAVGDFDCDLHPDILITDNPPTSCILMRNENGTHFVNVAPEMQLSPSFSGWGALWLDNDNDGWEDLFIALNSTYQASTGITGNKFYKNNSGLFFEEISAPVGISFPAIESFTCAMGDYNNDGYFDFVVNSPFPFAAQLYRNLVGDNNYLSVNLVGTYSNREAIGAKIECFAEDKSMMRYMHCGENFISQNSTKKIFGLHNYTMVDSLKIYWNRGLTETYYNLPVNQHFTFYEGQTLTESFDISTSQSPLLCTGDSITLSAPTAIGYLWSNGAETQSITINEPGEYFVQLFHQFGFEALSNTLQIEWAPEIEINEEIQHVLCHGENSGTIVLSSPGNSLLNIQWSNGETENYILNLAAGNYSYNLNCQYGCNHSNNLLVAQPEPLNGNFIISDVTCFGESDGFVLAQPSGGTAPIEIFWLGYNPLNLTAGVYEFMMIDYNACTVQSTFSIVEPDALEAELSVVQPEASNPLGNADVNINGGTPPYSVLWSDGSTGISNNALIEGPHWVLVTDSNSCSVEEAFFINSTSDLGINEQEFLLVFPNPASQYVIVELNEFTSGTIQLLNISGQVCLQSKFNGNREILNLSEISAGYYILKFEFGQAVHHLPLIKK